MSFGNYLPSRCSDSMTSMADNCSKCGSSNLKAPRYVRAQGMTPRKGADLNLISCEDCRFSEFYELTEDEQARIHKRTGRVRFFVLIIIPALISLSAYAWFNWGSNL